jgi:hypothetical protein
MGTPERDTGRCLADLVEVDPRRRPLARMSRHHAAVRDVDEHASLDEPFDPLLGREAARDRKLRCSFVVELDDAAVRPLNGRAVGVVDG